MIGTTVGSYRIISKLSAGGMGTVYRAQHELIGKLAAVKVLHQELCTNEEIVDRFFNEAKSTTAIKHPGIVEIFDFGYMDSGHAYLTMEFLEGLTLAERCEHRGKMTEGEAAMLLRSVCSALAAAHAKGIVHRDLKPDNIFMVPDPDSATGERPKILDFGIAKLTDLGLGGSVSATKTGAVMGTPTYMSPEQCKGTGEIDHRADLYSIGCIFYELVTGRPPFTELGAGELIGAHLYVEPAAPSTIEPTLSAETESLIMALLNKQPANRPQTARELSQRLAAIAQHQGWITQASPNGVTSQSLNELPVVARTSAAKAPESAAIPATRASVPENPTTLSGAASQSFIDLPNPKKSRKGKGGVIAIAAAVMVVGVVAIVKLGGGDGPPAEVTPARAEAPRAPDPVTKVEPAPAAHVDSLPEPAIPQAATEPAPAVIPPPTPPVAAISKKSATAPRTQVKAVAPTKPPLKPKTKPPETKPSETKPPEKKKPSLIETDL